MHNAFNAIPVSLASRQMTWLDASPTAACQRDGRNNSMPKITIIGAGRLRPADVGGNQLRGRWCPFGQGAYPYLVRLFPLTLVRRHPVLLEALRGLGRGHVRVRRATGCPVGEGNRGGRPDTRGMTPREIDSYVRAQLAACADLYTLHAQALADLPVRHRPGPGASHLPRTGTGVRGLVQAHRLGTRVEVSSAAAGGVVRRGFCRSAPSRSAVSRPKSPGGAARRSR